MELKRDTCRRSRGSISSTCRSRVRAQRKVMGEFREQLPAKQKYVGPKWSFILLGRQKVPSSVPSISNEQLLSESEKALAGVPVTCIQRNHLLEDVSGLTRLLLETPNPDTEI